MKNFDDYFSDIDLELHGVRLPEFNIDEKYYKELELDKGADHYTFLKALCVKGCKDRGIQNFPNKQEYINRLQYELNIFNELSLVDYVLLVWDVINYCRVSDIATGFGRGSAAGSLALYVIGVTQIDPIEHDLYFERFVSRARAKKTVVDGVTYLDGSLLMDVDLDICYQRRSEVVQYLYDKFEGKTSKILTFNTLSGKLLMKECGKIVGGKSETEMNMVSNMIPKIYGKVKDIAKAYEEVKQFKEWCDANPEVYKVALKLRDLIKNKGAHPSGYVVSYYPLDQICPTELTKDKEIVAGFDMNDISSLTVKLDLLGLRSATVIDQVCKDVGIKLKDIDLNDPAIYQTLQNLTAPYGLFQIEADTNCSVVQQVKPRNLSELSVCLALARPGALDYTPKFVDYVNKGEFQSTHPMFDDILKESGGIPVYQEQLMKMANRIGFTLDEAEILRRIVGKKKKDQVAEWEQKIYDKIKENGHDEEAGKVLWKVLNDSADYSFNKSHSLAYAALSATTIYLKTKYPKQFYLALLRMSRFEPDGYECIEKISQELKKSGIKLLPPHLIKSSMDFSIEGNDIRYGLLSIKGISDKVIEKINDFRGNYNNKFELFEAAKQSKISIGILSALIQAGALEGYGKTRSRVVLEAQLYNLLTDREKLLIPSFTEKYNHDLVKIIIGLKDNEKDEKGRPYIKESRYETIKKKYQPYLDIYEQNRKNELLANYWYEKSLLGYAYSMKLRDIFIEDARNLTSVSEVLSETGDDEWAEFVGIVSETKTGTSAKKTKWARFVTGDESGSINVMIFNENIENYKNHHDGKLPKENSILFVRGTKKGDAVFARTLSEQNHRIFMKLGDLKKV